MFSFYFFSIINNCLFSIFMFFVLSFSPFFRIVYISIFKFHPPPSPPHHERCLLLRMYLLFCHSPTLSLSLVMCFGFSNTFFFISVFFCSFLFSGFIFNVFLSSFLTSLPPMNLLFPTSLHTTHHGFSPSHSLPPLYFF
jgi:hypothetical protein